MNYNGAFSFISQQSDGSYRAEFYYSDGGKVVSVHPSWKSARVAVRNRYRSHRNDKPRVWREVPGSPGVRTL